MAYSTAYLKWLRDRIAGDAKSLAKQGIRLSGTAVIPLANKVVVYVDSATPAAAASLAAKYGRDTLMLRAGRLGAKPASNYPEGSPAPRVPPSETPTSMAE